MQDFVNSQTYQLILQASHCDDAIKHTVIALSSLSEHQSRLKPPVAQTPVGDENLILARSEYSKAVCQLQNTLSSSEMQSVELVLICCLLLIIFDFVSGDDLMAEAHLKAGLAILHWCYPLDFRERMFRQAVDVQLSHPIIYDLFRIFTVMNFHAVIWLGRPSYHSPPMLTPQALMISSRSNGINHNLDGIAQQLTHHIMQLTHFNTRSLSKGPISILSVLLFTLSPRSNDYYATFNDGLHCSSIICPVHHRQRPSPIDYLSFE